MKIAIFMNDLNGGGAEKIMIGYANYLSRHTNDKVVLVLARKKGPYTAMLNDNIEVKYLNKKKIYFAIMPLYSYLKTNKFDALYSSLIKPNLIAIMVGRLLGIKVIIRVANTIKEYQKSKKNFVDTTSEFLTRFIFKRTFKCIAISNIVKQDLVQLTNLSDDQVKVIYNPIITIDKLNNIQLEEGVFNVAIVCRLTPQKNIETIGHIIEVFAQKNYKVKFHFFGEGKDQDILEKIIEKYKGLDIIKLHGFELSYYSYIKQMQMFIHLPFWEGLGNSVLEVFNSGIPMILSNVESGYSELIKPEYSNIHYFAPKDVAAITSLLEKYVKSEVMVEPNRVKLDFTQENVYNKYRQLID